jgi:hypothetical protein
MKLQLALITAVLAVSTTVAQAADTRTPDILGSVSGESVQALSKADASQSRGESICIKWRALCLELWQSSTVKTEKFHPVTGNIISRVETPTYHISR